MHRERRARGEFELDAPQGDDNELDDDELDVGNNSPQNTKPKRGDDLFAEQEQEIERETQRRLDEARIDQEQTIKREAQRRLKDRIETTEHKQTQAEIGREVQPRVDKALKEGEHKNPTPSKPLVGDNATIIKNFNSLFDNKFKWDGDRETYGTFILRFSEAIEGVACIQLWHKQ